MEGKQEEVSILDLMDCRVKTKALHIVFEGSFSFQSLI